MSRFRPDFRLVAHVVPSPNRNERPGAAAPEILLLHYTGMRDMPTALNRLLSREARVSCHYFVCEDGAVLQLVPEAERAWHAGASFWERANDLNSRSIGVEIVNPGHEFGYRDFTEAQIATVIELTRDIVVRWGIRPDRVLGHSDVAPSRKDDPGERFPGAPCQREWGCGRCRADRARPRARTGRCGRGGHGLTAGLRRLRLRDRADRRV